MVVEPEFLISLNGKAILILESGQTVVLTNCK